MCNCENDENDSFFTVVITVVAVLSFVLGVIAGSAVTKAALKGGKKVKKFSSRDNNGSFNADEYVRSLNLD
ncbi:MAG: hypothetical protein LUI05_06510 [Oscillospiraceae bacterium]|nr:hypothetical protein [Oscillospiraceae bacterium]